MSSPVKIALLVLAATSFRIALNPPQPPPTDADRLYDKQKFFERFIRLLSSLAQACMHLITEQRVNAVFQVVEIALQSLSSVRVSSSPSLTVCPLFMCGVGLMYIAVLTRLRCYQALGSLFTFKVTIRPNRKLITSGPYAIVRHPSYTAFVLVNTGVIMTVFSAGSYVHECRILSTPAGVILVAWVALLAYATLRLLWHGEVEDEGLRKEFGVTWDNYRRSVPCKFIPGLV